MRPISAARAAAETPARGILFIILAVLLFACMDAFVKALAANYPIGQIVFFRNLFAFIPVALLVWRAGGTAVLRTDRLAGHLLRTTFGLGAMIAFFAALALMPLADAIAIAQSGPIFLTALSAPLLAERVGVRRWSAVVVGFAGVLIMVRPGLGVFDPAAVLALCSAVLYALAMISIRRLGATEPSITIVFYFTLFATIAGALSLPWQWRTPDAIGLALLIAVGLLGGSAQFAMTQAFRLAPVATIAPFEYAALVFAMLFGYLFWRDVPDGYILVGAAVVVGSGLYILHRETQLGQSRPPPPPPGG